MVIDVGRIGRTIGRLGFLDIGKREAEDSGLR